MADIRINALPTTASASSSDDYIALDGTTNGTRKLNAYSPTFGGNLTVSGTSALSGAVKLGSGSAVALGAQAVVVDAGSEMRLQLNSTDRPGIYFTAAGSNLATMRVNSTAFELLTTSGTPISISQSTLATTLAGNLTVSGTGNNIFNSGGGNFLVGTTTDGGQKLQVNGAALLGTDNASLGAYFDYNGGVSGNATLWLKQTTKSSSTYTLTGGGTYTALNAPSGGSIYLRINNSDALTLDSSANATFAGTGTSSFAGNLNIKGALGAHQTATLNLAYEGSSVSQLVAYGADASTLGRVNVILRKAGTGTDAVTGLSVRDFGIITQGGVAQTPASASATGTAGTIQWDASYIYICTATNTWKRVAIATW